MSDGIRHLMKHGHDDARGVAPGYHEMLWLGEVVRLDAAGRRHRHAWRKWLVMVCNNPGCPGKGLVDVQSLGALFPEGRD